MHSALPKVLHKAAGRPLLGWVVATARRAGCDRLVVVVGHGGERVREAIPGGDLTWVVQERQLGTGHALAQAAEAVGGEGMLFVLSGDVPLVTAATLEALATAAAEGWGAMAVADVSCAGALGRVVAGEGGRLERIVEAADATPEELALRRINAGVYALPAPAIFADLSRLEPDNAQGELYLTEALTAAARDGRRIALVELADPAEAIGVNDRRELARVHRLLLDRKADELSLQGVTVLEPSRTAVEADVCVGQDTEIHPGVSLLGHTSIGKSCTLHQGAWLRDTRLGDGVVVEPYSVLDGAVVEDGCRVGPFSRLRPASLLLEGSRVGSFVEVKASRLGPRAKINHLAYVGDAEVGEGANLGAGVVTCNFDGEEKHLTKIGAGAFIGSDTMLVAPVSVGERATTAAGSVVTRDVPPDALAIARSRQKNLPGWAGRPRPKRRQED